MPPRRSTRGSKTSPTTTSLLSLPSEIITTILDLHCQHLCESISNVNVWHRDSTVGLGLRDLLSPIHISSRIRAIALAHRPIWRVTAETVFLQLSARSHRNTLHLLHFCSRWSANTLSTVDLRGLDDPICPQKMVDLLSIVDLSHRCIKSLSLPVPDCEEPEEPCWCEEYCQNSDEDRNAMQDAWARSLDLIHNADSLYQLRFMLPPLEHLPSAKDLLHRSKTLQARPVQLDLDFSVLENPGGSIFKRLEGWLVKLAARVRDLSIDISMASSNERAVGELAGPIISAASSTLQKITLSGDPYNLVVNQLIPHSLPHLKIIAMEDWASGEVMTLSRPPAGRLYSSLCSIAVPAWILPHLETPLLQNAELLIKEPTDESVIIGKLQQWPALTTLALHTDMWDEAEAASIILQGILRSLVPREEGTLCPALKHIGIARNTSGRPDLFDSALEDDDRKDGAQGRQEGDDINIDYLPRYLREGPYIGIDLFRLANKRSQLSSELDSNNSMKCARLTMIKLRGPFVDPVALSLIREMAQAPRTLCSPDPIKLRTMLLQNDEKGLLPQVSEKFYKLNGR